MIDLINQLPIDWTIQITLLKDNGWLVVIINPNYVEASSAVGRNLEETLSHAVGMVKDKSAWAVGE